MNDEMPEKQLQKLLSFINNKTFICPSVMIVSIYSSVSKFPIHWLDEQNKNQSIKNPKTYLFYLKQGRISSPLRRQKKSGETRTEQNT